MSSQSHRLTSRIRRRSAVGLLAALAVGGAIVGPSALAAGNHAGSAGAHHRAKPTQAGNHGPTRSKPTSGSHSPVPTGKKPTQPGEHGPTTSK